MIKPYEKFLEYLYSLGDEKYKSFSSKLIFDSNIICIKTPILKKIAKDISKDDYNYFLSNTTHSTHEEIMIEGLLIGYLKISFDETKKLLDNFVTYINNWAICDQTAANLKIFNKNKDEGLKLIKEYLNSNNHWINRFGYILLLDYYVEPKYLNTIFNLCENYKDEYYVKMSIAWLISICYIKHKDITLDYLNHNKLDNWTYNKAIQKIIESNRINKDEKNSLKEMKRK